MKRALLAVVATASLMALGCDKKDEKMAPTPESDKAANKVSDKAVDTVQGIEKSVKGGADQAKEGVDKMSTQAVNAETLQNNIMDITGKIKKSLDEKKYDEAAGFVKQAKDLEKQLPADAQSKIDMQLADLDRQIAAGKALMGTK